jgi:hypothetical protein
MTAIGIHLSWLSQEVGPPLSFNTMERYPHWKSTGLFCLSRHDRHGRFLRDVQGSVQIGIVKDRLQAGNHLSIGQRVIREYTPDCAKHECKKCVAAPQRAQDG